MCQSAAEYGRKPRQRANTCTVTPIVVSTLDGVSPIKYVFDDVILTKSTLVGIGLFARLNSNFQIRRSASGRTHRIVEERGERKAHESN